MRASFRIRVLRLVLGWGLTLYAGPAQAIEYAAWITYHRRNEQTVDQYAQRFQSVSVFSWEFDTANNLAPATPWVEDELAALQAHRPAGRRHLATIVNDSQADYPKRKRGDIVLDLLSDNTKRATLISQIVAIAARADGVVIDFEALPAAARSPYTQFVQELRAALPSGSLLYLAVEPKTDLSLGSGGRAIDWAAVVPNCDALVIMGYYFHGSGTAPGPAASVGDLQAILKVAYQDLALPKNKVHMALTLWGTDWSSTGRAGLVSYGDMRAIARYYGASPQRDPGSQNWRLLYQDHEGDSHELWVDDGPSLQTKIQFLASQGVPTVHFWHLGSGDDAFWQSLGPVGGPAVSGLTPKALTVERPSARLDIDGSGFQPGAVVLWDGTARTGTVESSTRMTLDLSAQDLTSPRTVRLAIQNPDGQRSTDRRLAIVAPQKPLLAKLTPQNTPAARMSFIVRIDGSGFDPGTTMEWNGRPLETLFMTSQVLFALVPFDAVAWAGTYPMMARQVNGQVSNALPFDVLGHSHAPAPVVVAPVVTRLAPPSAAAGSPGLVLEIYGQDFAPGQQVQWGNSVRPALWVGPQRLELDLVSADLQSPATVTGWVADPATGQRSDIFHFTITDGPAQPAVNVTDPSALGAAYVHPNPWKARRDPPTMTWEAVPSGSKVKIFTAAAHHVRTLDSVGTQATWDLRTEGGDSAASGYYFYLIQSPDGSVQRGRFALIR